MNRSVRPSPLKSAAATPIPAFGSATPALAARSSKRKPSPAGSAFLPPGQATFWYSRFGSVVGDVEIEPPIAVEIGEDCTEAVIEPHHLEACLKADLAKLRMSLAVAPDVEVQEIADAGEVVREARSGAGNGDVGFGVARDVQVGPAVAVYVSDRGSRVPSVATDSRRAGALRERTVTVVPEQLVVARSRDVEIGEAVRVQVGRHAAFTTCREARLRPTAHVREPTLRVPEQ